MTVVAVIAAALSGVGDHDVHEVRGRRACGLWPAKFALCVVTNEGAMYRIDRLSVPTGQSTDARIERLERTLPLVSGVTALRMTAVDLLAVLEIDAYNDLNQLRRERPAWSCSDKGCSTSFSDPSNRDLQIESTTRPCPLMLDTSS